jgi:hypothetical protein
MSTVRSAPMSSETTRRSRSGGVGQEETASQSDPVRAGGRWQTVWTGSGGTCRTRTGGIPSVNLSVLLHLQMVTYEPHNLDFA